MRRFLRALLPVLEIFMAFPLVLIAILSRLSPRKIDIGLGPEPLINNIYHKRALEQKQYSAETFVHGVYYVTNAFDVRADLMFKGYLAAFIPYYLFALTVFRYRALYIYFNGGPLGFTSLLWRWEPALYKLAGLKIVVMPYGSDVQDLSRSPNALFKHVIAQDYPDNRLRRVCVSRNIDLWTSCADHVVGGCEWVDYMYHWDTLMIAHFSIDTDYWTNSEGYRPESEPGKLKILHAPNHRRIKGTDYFIKAIDELNQEGFEIELVIIEKVPNDEVKKAMASVDVVADQLIAGWYAMFALEAMAMGKPVLSFLREDLIRLYIDTGLVEEGEIPIINSCPATVKENIRQLALNINSLPKIGEKSREYVLRRHSLSYVGDVFAAINTKLGLKG